MKSIADTAHSLGLKVMAHAHGARGIEPRRVPGIDSIEHGTYLDEAAARAMKDNGTVLVPALMAFKGVTERLGQGVYTGRRGQDPRCGRNRARLHGQGAALGRANRFRDRYRVFGHGRNAGEFALMVEQGMSHRDAFAAATTHAARVLGLENEIGRIAGYSADLIAVEANPLDDTSTLENVDWVMVRGRVID